MKLSIHDAVEMSYWKHQKRSPRVMTKPERKRVHRKVGVRIEDVIWRFIEDPEMELCIMGKVNDV
ncbi:unnamed protein product [marine sediment metagenome]|uniref:Uncharacterized protein n=1 Tax=marine sediment metagenome TaxID=412755 RepID=X0VT92_9ZZZZ